MKAFCLGLLLLLALSSTTVGAFSSPVKTLSPGRTSGYQRTTISTRRRMVQQQQQEEKEDVRLDPDQAMENVGWGGLPNFGGSSDNTVTAADQLTADDPFVQAIDAGIQRDFGVPLEDLLNPAKVVNLERDLLELRQSLAQQTGVVLEADMELNADNCDGGGGGPAAEETRQAIAKKQASLDLERRAVFRGWLKNVFLLQAVLSLAVSYVMATNPATLFGGFDWFSNVYNMDVSIQVLGYWWWWLFIIPSLRSRRPKGAEKKALDLAFLASPALSLLAPVVTKDTGLIWLANLLVVAGCYGFAFVTDSDDDDTEQGDDANAPGWLKFVFKSLDFGSGRERGVRK